MKDLKEAKQEALTKAWKSFGAYKFVIGGYWAGVWVVLNKLEEEPEPNPFADLVKLARGKTKKKEGNSGEKSKVRLM